DPLSPDLTQSVRCRLSRGAVRGRVGEALQGSLSRTPIHYGPDRKRSPMFGSCRISTSRVFLTLVLAVISACDGDQQFNPDLSSSDHGRRQDTTAISTNQHGTLSAPQS